ncbi:MAG TPA: hypothetical protein VL463_21555 [Kofleriaceae bacterium]|nr:hypothetical protein [Kofleriaceae bacterium]
MRAVIVVCLLAACGGKSSQAPDAAPPDAHVPRAVVYLSFDGEMVMPPASGTDSDAATNTTAVVSKPTTLPPYLDGATERDARIAAIVTAVGQRLHPYDVEVVTTRPTEAGYTMMLFTGDATLVGQGSGLSAMAPFDCTKPQPTAITILFQSSTTGDTYGPEFKANLVIGALGFEHQLPPVAKTGDCMCWVGSMCGDNESACTVGGAGTPVETSFACQGSPAMIDEQALFTAALGARP